VTSTLAPVIRPFNPDDTSWGERGACRTHNDPDIWHADETSSDERHVQGKAEAKRICNTQCPVKYECLQYALRSGQVKGIWGGLGTRERNRLRKRLVEQGALPCLT
jgi:WhiB family redox-sensing transcriptional regulator